MNQESHEKANSDMVAVTLHEAEYKLVNLSDMHPADYNPRFDLQPGDIRYEQLKKSIESNGLVQPIVWNKRTGNIVGGHQRYKILVDAGVEKVICAVVDKSLEDEKAANIAMNRAHGSFEDDLLANMLSDMDWKNFDPDEIGFDRDEIEHILSGIGTLTKDDIFDSTIEVQKKEAMIKCPHCGKKFEERGNRV